MLLIMRALQAVGVSASIVVGAGIDKECSEHDIINTCVGVISDIFPPKDRGPAFGIFGIPPLFGPIVGPVIGGVIANTWGWRSTFYIISVLGKSLVLR